MTYRNTLLALVLVSPLLIVAQDGVRPDLADADSLSLAFQKAARSLSSPQLETRKAERLRLQRRGYCAVLQACGESDAISAMLALLRTRAQVAIHMPHTPLSVHVPIHHVPSWSDSLSPFSTYGSTYYTFTLTEDWSIPADPWAVH